MLKPLFSILLICFFLAAANAQNEKLQFKNISTLDGLSQNLVRCIYQDDFGYMWFGTADGLNRYDGYEFKVFFPNPKNKFSIGSMFINHIAKKSDHELWICTQNGVYIYNQLFERFYLFKPLQENEINTVFEDSEKTIWFGGAKGLFRFNPNDSSLVTFKSEGKPGSLSDIRIKCLFEDDQKNLWIGTNCGLNLYDRKNNKFYSFLPSNSLGKAFSNIVYTIENDCFGRLWVGVIQGGLLLFNYSPQYPEKSKFDLVLKCSPSCLIFDNDSNLWIGNGGSQGLNILNIKNYKVGGKADFSTYFQSENSDVGISSNSILSFCKDKLGDIWLGTYGGGIDFYSKRAKKFYNFVLTQEKRTTSSNLVNSILEEKNFLWIGTENGLARKNKQTGEIIYYRHDKNNPGSIGANAIYKVFKDSRGLIWIGSWNGGLSLFDYKTEAFKNYGLKVDENSLSNGNIFSICEDNQGNLWLGSIYGGLFKFDYNKNTFTSFRHNESDPGSLNGDVVHHVFITKQGSIWISLYESGLDFFDQSRHSFKHFVHNPNDPNSLGPGFILSVFEDSKGNIWVASNMGLNLYNPTNNSFRHFTIEDGLPNNTIQAILEDGKGNLWLSTNKGLAVFNNAVNKPSVPCFRVYGKADGLPGNEFSIRAAYKNTEGYFYFGTSQGYTYFHPDSIQDNLIPPSVVITDFELIHGINNEKTNNLLFDKDIKHHDELTLSYSQSDFIIKYSALNFLNSENNQYKYCLAGYEDNWHFVGNQRIATYTNIQPGEYIFQVYGSNNDGIWSISPKSLKIIIKPPWWKTLIFKTLASIIFVLFIILIFKLRMNLLEKQKKMLRRLVNERTNQLMETNALLEEKSEEIAIQNEELSRHRNNLEQLIDERTAQLEAAKIKAEESDRLKSAFLANMSHEIRTPMNAIIGFANLLDEYNLSNEDKRKFINMINLNSETLMVLIDDIIDISLIESNQLAFNTNIFNATKILLELEEYYNLKNTKGLIIEFTNNHNDRLMLELDQVRFWQILNNLINNAYKYTEKGSIKFGYDKLENEVHFFVSDTGIGIEQECYQSIFDHFNKIENKGRKYQRGAGIGLAICKRLVTKMGGKIWVESEINVGSTFHLILPAKSLHTQVEKEIVVKNITTSLNSIRVIVAEDEPTNFELLKMYLRNVGVEVFWAKNGFECVNFLHTFSDKDNLIVLMDIKMPVMDGYEALHEIKKIEAKIPVIAITAYAQANDKERILNEGFDEYLPKPIRRDALLKTLSKFSSFL